MSLGGGRLLVALGAALTLALSSGCAGESMDPGSAAAGAGGTGASGGAGGTGALGGGGAGGAGGASGGSGATAGTGSGTSTGGSSGDGAGAGAGGSGGITVIEPGCPDCPAGDYGLVIHGDGDDYRMEQTVPDSRDCPAEPLRGSLGGCGGSSLYLSACESVSERGPCLELNRADATYTDRDGTVWTGVQLQLTRAEPPMQWNAGTVTLELTAGARMLTLTVDYAFCNDGAVVRIVCD